MALCIVFPALTQVHLACLTSVWKRVIEIINFQNHGHLQTMKWLSPVLNNMTKFLYERQVLTWHSSAQCRNGWSSPLEGKSVPHISLPGRTLESFYCPQPPTGLSDIFQLVELKVTLQHFCSCCFWCQKADFQDSLIITDGLNLLEEFFWVALFWDVVPATSLSVF